MMMMQKMRMVGKDRKKAELIKHLDEVCHHDDDVEDEDGWQGSELIKHLDEVCHHDDYVEDEDDGWQGPEEG